MATIETVKAVAITVAFADYFGGADKVPATLSSPSSHFRTIKRMGQAATLVRITDSDGHVGLGECFGLPSAKPAEILINELIGPALIGRELAKPDALLAEWRTYFTTLGNTRGPAMEALSGTDIALWDLAARRDGKSLAAHLGGSATPIECYASPIPMAADVETSITAAHTLLDDGFRALKLKIGRDVALDLEHVAAVRAALPGGTALMLDANCAYTLDEAKALLRGLEPLDIGWLEEPLSPGDTEGLAALAEYSDIPIAAGENEFTLAAFQDLLVRGRVRIVQPNITRAGGVSGLIAIGRMACDHGAAISPHGVGASVGVAALLHTCAALPGFSVTEANRLLNPLRDEVGLSFRPDGEGRLPLPEGPGHGGCPDAGQLRQLVEHRMVDELLGKTAGPLPASTENA